MYSIEMHPENIELKSLTAEVSKHDKSNGVKLAHKRTLSSYL